MKERLPRKLAAILYADVAGYSRLTGEDEDATHRSLSESLDRITVTIERHGGRVMHYAGDAVLAMFEAVVDALSCAVQIQSDLKERNEDLADGRKVEFRIGVNLGDVIEDRDDIYGDGVNVAARLESLAEPGGICVSEAVRSAVGNKLALAYASLGERRVKNIAEPVRAYRVLPEHAQAQRHPREPIEIHYCATRDGVHLAYAGVGQGPPLVKAASYLTHLQYDAEGIIFRHWIRELSREFRYIRYDERGNGLSDWDVGNFSFEAMVNDLEAVVDEMELERFALFGISQGASVSIEYAHRHPERVACLVIYGGYAAGWRKAGDEKFRAKREALLELARVAWDDQNPVGRQAYATLFLPDGSPEEHAEFNKMQQLTTTSDNAYRILATFSEIDVRPILPEIAAPTLVMHCRDDAVVPFRVGRDIAASIPGARFVSLEGNNHVIRETDSSWPRFLSELTRFVREHA